MTFRDKFKDKTKVETSKLTNVTTGRIALSLIPFIGNYFIYKYKMPVDYKSAQLIIMITTVIAIIL